LLDSKARDLLEGVSSTAGRIVARTGLTPNAVTAGGLAVVVVAAWLVVQDRMVAGGVVLAASGLFDFLDGAVARATGKASRMGAFLDSVTDRLTDGVILGAIVYALAQRGDEVGVALALASLVLGGAVSYVRAKAESLGFDCKVGFAERAERIIALIVGLVLSILTPVLAVLAVASAVTVVQRLVHVGRQARAR